MSSARVLIVDDEPYTRRLLHDLLSDKGVETDTASSGATARTLFDKHDYNLVVMDQRLPGENGLDLVREMRRQRPRLVGLLVTGYADVQDAMRAIRDGLFDYLTKPFENLEALEAVIERALELDRAYREIDILRRTLDERRTAPALIGHAPCVQHMLMQIRQVAPLDTTILVEGESGTGKELVARLVHTESTRSGGPFVAINCGALSEQLLESTLFGFEKGAFTGAAQATPGCIETAHGGTLFLDEIADMSPKLQCSLLRVLQERSFQRIGSQRVQTSDFRLVCATNRPLAEAVRSGGFREDLYYRINVVRLSVPSLRERRQDITLLAAHFLDDFNREFGKQVGPLTQEAMERLEQASWPGNVRELKHAIERIVALKGVGSITAADLPPLEQRASVVAAPWPISYQQARESFEREYLTRLLESASGNVSEAARLSGITRQNLYVRMKRWGLDSSAH